MPASATPVPSNVSEASSPAAPASLTRHDVHAFFSSWGFAQTGGLLVCEYNHFREKVVLAKVPKITFHCEAVPGDVLTYHATIEYIKDTGAMVAVTSHKGDVLHAEGELVFAHFNEPKLGSLFDPATFLRMMRLLGAYDVGVATDGGKLEPPPHLLNALHSGNGEAD